MTRAAKRYRSLALGALALVAGALSACHDDAVAPLSNPTPSGPMANLGSYIVHVDVKRGFVTVESADTSRHLPPGMSARFFGNFAQVEDSLRFIAPTLRGDGDMEYHLQLRIGNLLPVPIGTNSPHVAPAFPQDTMGVYVFYSFPPYNITGAGTVVVDSADGTYPFLDLPVTPQPYVYFKTILEAGSRGQYFRNFSDQSGIGGFDYFRTLKFRASPTVTNFSFGIAVSAPTLAESRFKVHYVADSVPNRLAFPDNLRSEPDWRVFFSFTSGSATISSPGHLQMASTPVVATEKDTLEFFRSDSLHDQDSAYIGATMTASTLGTGTLPAVFLGLQDQTKAVILGISGTNTGFADCNGAFVGTTTATDLTRSTWRVAKYGADSAAIFSPDDSIAPIVRISRALLPVKCTKTLSGYDRFFFFGNITQPGGTTATSVWQVVNYEIGATKP